MEDSKSKIIEFQAGQSSLDFMFECDQLNDFPVRPLSDEQLEELETDPEMLNGLIRFFAVEYHEKGETAALRFAGISKKYYSRITTLSSVPSGRLYSWMKMIWCCLPRCSTRR